MVVRSVQFGGASPALLWSRGCGLAWGDSEGGVLWHPQFLMTRWFCITGRWPEMVEEYCPGTPCGLGCGVVNPWWWCGAEAALCVMGWCRSSTGAEAEAGATDEGRHEG